MPYLTGHVKRNTETGAVAIRTHFDESIPQLARRAWQVATSDTGGRGAFTADVEDWDDLFIPEAGS